MARRQDITWTNDENSKEHISMEFHLKFKVFFQENVFEKSSANLSVILFRPLCIKSIFGSL